MDARERTWALAALLALSVASAAQAQPDPARGGQAWTGYELALDGPRQVRMGRTARYRGVAYRVRGLRDLVTFGGRVRARVHVEESRSGAWVEVRTGADGRFDVELPVPVGIESQAEVQVEVGPASEARSFAFTLAAQPAVRLVLRTDRNLYESSEPVHVWAWLVDEASGRPIEGQAIGLDVAGESIPAGQHEIRTGASGVAHLELRVPDGAPEGQTAVTATIEGQLEATTHFSVGTRTYERVLATVEIEPEPVAPGNPATVVVTATATSGAPITGAQVQVRVGAQREQRTWTGTTGADGVARIAVRAPVYAVHDTGSASVRVDLHHPAHGSVVRIVNMRLAVPLSLSLEVVPRHGGLVPEIDDLLYVRLHNGIGEPPAQPTEITVTGPAVRGERASATTDVNGIAAIPARLPIGAASSRSGTTRTSVLVEVTGPLQRVARVNVPVFRNAEVLPTPSQSIVAPGDRLTVRVDRRPSAARQEVVLELLDARSEVLRLVWLTPRQRSVELVFPDERVGLMTLRARARHADETLEGVGGLAQIIVRPADPGFVRVDPVRPRWTVGETARVNVHTGVGGPRRWAAVLVRDLAAHSGERSFQHHFLRRRFSRALLEASGASGDRLVSAALAAHVSADADIEPSPPLVDALGLSPSSSRGGGRGLRDPWPLARELERRGAGSAMRALEARLESALASGGLDAVTTTSRGRRAFRDDLLELSRSTNTLGGGLITASALEASDPSFTFDNVARRVARARLLRLMVVLASYLDPGDTASPAARMAARESSDRWLPRMVERGLLEATDLDDPWGHRFSLRATRNPTLVLSAHATQVELVSPGPDGRVGTSDDVRDPFVRAVPARTPYAMASGEDRLMRQLSVLSPVQRTLAAIRRSYTRISAEMSEDEIGDAVAAQVSEGTIGLGNFGTIGHGGGSGSGHGYGRGAGGLRGRSARVPRVRTGMASVSGLAAVVRERFPPTLLFTPSLELDASGTTEVPIPLADAVTTFLVEVVVWREDGWVWSDNTRIEVDREIVIAAPVPQVAHLGDRISLPLRVANHGDVPRELEVRLAGSEALGIADAPAQRVTVPAGDARAVQVTLAPSRAGEGTLAFAVVTPDGEALDAVRLPMRVVDVVRQVTQRQQSIAAGRASLEFTVPRGAEGRNAHVQLSVGTSLFESTGTGGRWLTWAPGARHRVERRFMAPTERSPIWLAFATGSAWTNEEVEDAALDEQIDRLSTMLDSPRSASRIEDRWRVSSDDEAAVFLSSWALLGLRQVVEFPGRRRLPRALRLIERLQEQVGTEALSASDPGVWVLAAAALGWTSSPDDLGRTQELVRRLSRHTVEIGEDRWLALERTPVRGTVLWAMAELALGHRERAFSGLATVNRWADAGHPLHEDILGLARAATRRLMDGPTPEQVNLTIDGVPRTVSLVAGSARVDAAELATPGVHVIAVDAGSGAPVFVRARARYGVPWTAPTPIGAGRGPLALSVEGGVGDLARPASLEIVARNRAPRTLQHPIVEVQLPTGAELPPTALAELGVRVERLDDLLTLHLPAMRPGNERRIPLHLRWSVAGELRGLGLSGRADDRPEAVTALAPRTVTIREVSQ